MFKNVLGSAAARAAPDMPGSSPSGNGQGAALSPDMSGSSPGGNGQDAAPPPFDDLDTIAQQRRKGKGKKAKAPEERAALPDEASPAPELPSTKRGQADFNVEDIIVSDSDEDEYSDAAPVIPRLTDKLPKAKYIQVHRGKGSQTQLYAIKLDEEDQRPGELNSYVLTKPLRDFFINELSYTVTKMNVCDVCTIQGNQSMYMYPATSGLSNNSWNVSRSRMLEAASREWVIVNTNMEIREYVYRIRKAHLKPVTPRYPTEPIAERAVKALQGGRLISSKGHPVVKRLLGMTEEDEGRDDE
jgi:hypothetical protein